MDEGSNNDAWGASQAGNPGRDSGGQQRDQQRGDTERIRARAYELYQARGETPGDETEDWLQAEREQRGSSGDRQDRDEMRGV